MNLRVLLFSAVVLIAGCNRDSSDAPAAKAQPKARAPAAASHGPTAQEMTAGMVEATTQGKSQTPVTLKFDLLQRPVQGQPLEIAIAVLPQSLASPATVDVSASDGLQLASGDSHFEFASVEPAQVYRHTIKVTPTVEGVYFVTLNVGLKREQMADSRVFSLPIIVAPAAAPLTPAPGAAAAVRPSAPPTSRN